MYYFSLMSAQEETASKPLYVILRQHAKFAPLIVCRRTVRAKVNTI